jgi:hypothetical protein
MARRCKGCGRFRKQRHKCPTTQPKRWLYPELIEIRKARADRICQEAKKQGISLSSIIKKTHFAESNLSNLKLGLSSDIRYERIEELLQIK